MTQLFATLFHDRVWQLKAVAHTAIDKQLAQISRGDQDLLLYGFVRTRSLSKHWQKYDYFRECNAQGTALLRFHPYFFALESMSVRNKLDLEFRAYRMKHMKLRNHYLIYNEEFTGWHKQVVQWYNDKVSQGFEANRKQLYLWGGAGVGKTSFINYIFSKCCFYYN